MDDLKERNVGVFFRWSVGIVVRSQSETVEVVFAHFQQPQASRTERDNQKYDEHHYLTVELQLLNLERSAWSTKNIAMNISY